jgi:type I restriction enzyme M protein
MAPLRARNSVPPFRHPLAAASEKMWTMPISDDTWDDLIQLYPGVLKNRGPLEARWGAEVLQELLDAGHLVADGGRVARSKTSVDAEALWSVLPDDGSAIGNQRARMELGWRSERRYDAAKRLLLTTQEITLGRGRGGSIKRAEDSDPDRDSVTDELAEDPQTNASDADDSASASRTGPDDPTTAGSPGPTSAMPSELRNKIDRIWNAFWSGGISNPLEVIEQITYLLFLRRLDDLQMLAEKKARITGGKIEDPKFLPGQDNLRWSRFKNLDADVMYQTVATKVFPFLQKYGEQVGGDDSTYSDHMKDARFTIPTPALLSKVVDMLDTIPMEHRDTNGDLYEYMLGKIASAGQNGQFRTPRHIIKLMVDMTAPQPTDEICDPACGTAGFLVAASEHVREHHPSALTDATQRAHFHRSMFHGYDFDNVMLRIGSMNMLLHGVEAPDIRYRDSLSEGASEDAEKYTLILANPPFAGSLDYEATSKDLQRVVKTKKTELLFLALFLKLLKPGGRAAVIVPDGVLFGSENAHKELRRILVEDQRLDAVVKLPSGVFRPYAGVSTAILLFTKTNSGGTGNVWFYDVRADGFSLDDKRNPVETNDLPDVLARWQTLAAEKDRARTEQSFLVPKADIAGPGYELSFNRYKETEHAEIEHRAPLDIIADIEVLEDEIADGLTKLKAMLS